MIPVLCIDVCGGTMFHRRRQSQDRLVRRDIMELSAQRRLWMNAYSFRQFCDVPPEHITVNEAFLDRAKEGEFCFVEGLPLLPYLHRIERVVLYCWNRRYPADTFLDLPLQSLPWRLQKAAEFPGYSHKTITKEIYTR